MIPLLDTHIGGVIVVTVIMMGFAAWTTGRAIAITWRPHYQAALYPILLGFVDRGLHRAFADGELWSLSGYLLDTAFLVAVSVLAHRLSRVRKLTTQYPWLYERTGPFTCRSRPANEPVF
jgi:hypothetical protein